MLTLSSRLNSRVQINGCPQHNLLKELHRDTLRVSPIAYMRTTARPN